MTGPDLLAVDELCRLVLAARRLGCGVHLTGVDPRLRRVLALAGIEAVVAAGPGPRPRRCPGALRPPVRRPGWPVP